MPGYNLTVLGLDLSFAADVPPERIHKAVDLVHQRYRDLQGRASSMSKERLLTYLALSLADDYLQDQGKLSQLEGNLQQLLSKIDSPEE
jgi:cell division protein ZapA